MKQVSRDVEAVETDPEEVTDDMMEEAYFRYCSGNTRRGEILGILRKMFEMFDFNVVCWQVHPSKVHCNEKPRGKEEGRGGLQEPDSSGILCYRGVEDGGPEKEPGGGHDSEPDRHEEVPGPGGSEDRALGSGSDWILCELSS